MLKTPPKSKSKRLRKAKQVHDLVDRADGFRKLGIVPELESIVAALPGSSRGWQAIELRLGLGGEPPKTLQETGERLRLTRERVRQLEKRIFDLLERQSVWTPALAKGIRKLSRELPLTEDEVWKLLRQEQLLAEGESLPLESLERIGLLLGKRLSFEVRDEWLVPSGSADALDAVGRVARKLISHWGTATVSELIAILDEEGKGELDEATARIVLDAAPGLRWLDSRREWFWITGLARNRLLNQVEKIMSVAGSIDAGELRDGVGRHHRMKGFRPPREILMRLCEDCSLYSRDGSTIVGGAGLPDWRTLLGKNERTIVAILFEEGSVMRRDELERRAVEKEGLNRNSFYAYLAYSPVLERYAPGVFGLRGAKITAAEVKAMIPPRVRTQVLQDHGWTADGRVWIAYKLSSASRVTGVLGVPSVLDDLLRGSYALASEDNRHVGTLTIEDSMWGLSPFFNRRGVEAGDHIVVTFDLAERSATIATGGEDLLVQVQKGE